MKNLLQFSHLRWMLPVWMTIAICPVIDAQVEADLQAIENNGHVAIQVINNGALVSYFTPDANNQVSLDFYFGPDDARNGFYQASADAQISGSVYLTFSDIPYAAGDTLTFSALETMPDNSIREYLFIEGKYVPDRGGPINICPVRIECKPGALTIIFPEDYPIGTQQQTPVSIFFGAGYPYSIYHPNPAVILSPVNGFQIKNILKNFDCQNLLSDYIIVVINGMTCVFLNGQLVGLDNVCSPSSQYYEGYEECAGYFEECTPELIQLIIEHKSTLPCRQWRDDEQCNTTAKINRAGKVAIGTSGFSASMLTVKNGVITDKVKVETCGSGGWCDYVFDDNYSLMPLESLEAYIEKYRHLPGIPSGDVIEADGGFELGETTRMHQEKIEEIFLHLIALDKEVETLELTLEVLQVFEKINIK